MLPTNNRQWEENMEYQQKKAETLHSVVEVEAEL